MNSDFLDPVNSKGMPNLADSMFAMDFLITVKSGVRNAAISLTETITPEARAIARAQLEQGIALHEELSQLMVEKGWLHPYNVSEQFKLDIISADTTMKVAGMKLFPDHTSRLGMFADLDH